MASTGDHGDVGRLIARRARQIQAELIVVGAPLTTGMAAAAGDAIATTQLAKEAPCDVLAVAGRPASASAAVDAAGQTAADSAQPVIDAGQRLRA
jgi:hypothetical protein